MGDVSPRIFYYERPITGGEGLFAIEYKRVKELPCCEWCEQPAAYPCGLRNEVTEGSEMRIEKFKSSREGIDCKGNAGL